MYTTQVWSSPQVARKRPLSSSVIPLMSTYIRVQLAAGSRQYGNRICTTAIMVNIKVMEVYVRDSQTEQDKYLYEIWIHRVK